MCHGLKASLSDETRKSSGKRFKPYPTERDFDAFAGGTSLGDWREVKHSGSSSKRLREEDILRLSNKNTRIPPSQTMEVDMNSEDNRRGLNQVLCNKSGDSNDNAPCLPSTQEEHVMKDGESRDSDMNVNTVPDASQAITANIDREIYYVSGNILKARDLSGENPPEIHKFVRYEDDHKGKAYITLRLPPDQTTIKKATAEFKDFRDANCALDKIESLENPVKLRANLEQRSVICKGVISDWPSSIPDLWKNIRDRSRILSLERMYRRKWDAINNKTTLLATDNIIITFKDNKIRDLAIFSNGINLRVRPYVPQVRQCFNCFRFGHTKLNCKSETRCIVCGDKSHGQCEKEVRCYNCGGPHKSTFRGCPSFEKSKNINLVMAHKNTTFHQAKRIVEGDIPAPLSESRNKFIDQSSWPGLLTPAGLSYSEALRVDSRPTSRALSQRDKGENPPRYNKDKRIYDAPRNFYSSFDLRAGEITKENRGIMLYGRQRTGSGNYPAVGPEETGPHEKQRISETIESILLLLRRVPGARALLMRALAAAEERVEPGGDYSPPPDKEMRSDEVDSREFLRGYRCHQNELSKISMEYDIVILTETRCTGRNRVHLPGFKTLHSNNNLGSGGVSISVRSHITFDIIKIVGALPAEYDVIGIRTSNLVNNVNIIAVYRHPRAGIGQRDFNPVFNSANGDLNNTLILGDFNAQNTAWNCAITNKNGEILHDLMANKGLSCVNVDTKSRNGYSGQRDSNIDLLFAAGDMAGDIEYSQLEEPYDSDHVPICFSLDNNTQPYRKLSNKTSTKRTDWSRYQELIKEYLQPLLPNLPRFGQDFTSYYQSFTDALRSAVRQASGARGDGPTMNNSGSYKRSHRWWNADCDAAVKERRRAFLEFKKLRNIHSWNNYKRLCAVTRKTLSRAKKENFEEFCKGINKFTSLSYVWSTMRIMKNARKRVEWNKWQTNNREAEIRKTIDSLAPPFVGINPSYGEEYDNMDVELDAPFTRPELDRALEMIRRDSAPGMDGMEYKMLRLLPEDGRSCLLELFNIVWSSGVLPADWLCYQVIFIDKVGREKVRPISLSSCVGKLMERMINERLIWWAEKKGKFSSSQSGFRRGKSCADNLARITSDIRAALSAGEYTLAAFLDVSSAYDSVEFHVLLDRLVALGCPAGIFKFVRNWLYRRRARFIVNSGEFIDRFVFRGLPQGAVLSPVLYALFTQLLRDALPEGVEMVEFADDIGLYVSSRDWRRNRNLLEQAVNIVADILKQIGLDLEPRKTVLVEFNKTGFVDKELSIKVQGCDVFNCDCAKFLGIWLDSSLNFHRQIQEVRGKVNRANSIMRYLCGVSRGMEVNTALMLYKSIVRSITDYGIFVYFPRDMAFQTRLERTQYMGIRTALGYRNSTPNNVIVAEAKVTLLRDRAVMLGRNFVTKAIAHNNNGLCLKLERTLDRENFCRYRQPMYKFSMLSEIWRKLRFRKNVGSGEQYEVFRGPYGAHSFRPCVDLTIGEARKRERFPDELLIRRITERYEMTAPPGIIYTDGSYDESRRSTGASIVISDQDEAYKISLPGLCSSYTAEVFAIKSALQVMIGQQQNRSKEIIILSDCKSALQSIYNNHINVYKNRYVVEARRYIYELETIFDKRVVLVWIPSHVGIEGNEVADDLAKEASLEEADHSIEVSVGDYRMHDKREAWLSTQNSIKQDSAHKGAFYFQHFYDDLPKPWFHKINADRYFVTVFNRLRANHFNLKSSLKRKGYIDDERCDCGYERENLYHVLLRCSKFDDHRIVMDNELREANYMGDIDLIRIIKDKQWDILYIIFKFIKKIGKII
ncbi:uncharacterized protein [Temnothorax nylanderi]|uniref:uncharacterized protein n=1 Tax=Temnothorax nylanderi TaxID=102681 RepID=UPI003A83FDCC